MPERTAARKVYRVLELGCEMSPVTRWLLLKHPGREIEYHGVDLNSTAKPGKIGRMTHYYYQMLAEDFLASRDLAPDGHFDEVHMHLMGTQPFLARNLRQFSRILRPGGVVYAAEDAHPPQALTQQLIDGAFATTRLPFFRTKFVPTSEGREIAEEHNKALAGRITRAGFEIIRASLFDMKARHGTNAEVPVGVESVVGKRLPAKSAIWLLNKLSAGPALATQFLILRKRPESKQ